MRRAAAAPAHYGAYMTFVQVFSAGCFPGGGVVRGLTGWDWYTCRQRRFAPACGRSI